MTRLIIDVREPEEFAIDHVEGAINLTPKEILDGAIALKDVPQETELVLYCVSGSRSNFAIIELQKLGYNNIVNGINKYHVKSKYSV